MSIPGSNLLNRALSVIKPDNVTYRKFKRRTTNSVGIYVEEYESDVEVKASVQAVSNYVYKELGLDFQKAYVRIYISVDVIDLSRDVSGDRFIIFGNTYQLMSSGMWFPIDGWVGLTAVQILSDLEVTPHQSVKS